MARLLVTMRGGDTRMFDGLSVMEVIRAAGIDELMALWRLLQLRDVPYRGGRGLGRTGRADERE